ncbi:MAG: 16S rRNA (guanine(966)-N(2))-methyltransferase RsmD [Bariatricus sp.]|nr:16S rRNA (guanine(966)-N(2))-methyltransferase RsmD [Bariatricus sp.]
MRVIAGKARRIQLKTIEGMDTRPTTDRIKETLFNMISHGLCDSSFLDLFAGSGGIGIEALSRGAKCAVFVEKNPRAASCIRENLTKTHLADQADVLVEDVIGALRKMEGHRKFDYVFMDPPYNHLMEKQVLEYLATSDLLEEDALVIVEASLETDFSYLEEFGFSLVKRKEYKTNAHVFVQLKGEDPC